MTRALALTALTMVAFAANSVLNRMALAEGAIDPVAFGSIRLLAGAAMLGLLVALRPRPDVGRAGMTTGRRATGVLSLLVYVYGFSLAYLSLDAGAGALILFGMVQITMFAAALLSGERPPARRWAGAVLALGGLAWLLWPGAGPLSAPHAALMAAAGIAWGVYSLAGQQAGDPLRATAANFALAAPLGLVAGWLTLGAPSLTAATPPGIVLAVLSGAVTSGLGYALWYTVLPRLSASTAAVAQLTVPVIALAAGALLLAEVPGLRTLLASALVLGGVALAVLSPRHGGRG